MSKGSEAERANQRLLDLFSKVLIPAMAVMLVLLVIAFVGMFIFVTREPAVRTVGDIVYPPLPTDPRQRDLIIHLAQVGIGTTIGFLCLFLGAVMCWFGITGTFTVGAESAGGKLQVQGTHIGLVLLIGGILLSAMTLQKSPPPQQVDSNLNLRQTFIPYDVKTGQPIRSLTPQ